MTKPIKIKVSYQQAYKPLLAAALAVAGAFNLISAVVAAGTPAGTPINNTATGTYNDGSGNTIDAVSNTVTITVAEVAGLTVSSSGFNDTNGGSIVGGDTLTYDFQVTNTGNAPTYIFVPGADGITVTNGTPTRVDIVDANGNVIANIPAGGITTQNLTGLLGNGLVDPDNSLTVRVTVTAATLPNPVGQFVGVQFGDTTDENTPPDSDGSQNQQNIPNGTSNNNEVRTLNEGTTEPVNGEREAAAFRQEAFNTAPITLAQALLLKTSIYSNSGTTADPADDTIVYNLELRIGNQSFPSTSVDPGRLEGTSINLNSAVANRILVSDAIPANTVFDDTFTPTAPTGWTTVYSIDPAATTNPLQAQWTTARPATASIQRVGFVYDATTNAALAPLTTVTGFSFRVVTSNLTPPGGNIANIAQVFGETEGDAGNNIVYDESGDQNPNNFDDGVTPTTRTTTFDPNTDFGIGNAADPEQTSNQNDGTGPDGESNIVQITVVPAVTGNLFNGPNGTPTATGPTNTNDDFTNASAGIPPAQVGSQGTPSDPNAVTITNQVQNPAGAPTRLDTVTLLPLPPSAALAAAGTGIFGNDADLPNGTRVTITFGSQTAVYEYTDADGSGPNPGIFHTPGNTATVPAPVVVGTLNPGDVQTYTVTVDLPAGTRQVAGYGIPIAAFVDNDGNGVFTPATETVSNITIDRVYTGFMRLLKEVSVDGTNFFSSTTDLASLQLRPGDDLTYRITYENISEAAPTGGGGNILLNANNFVIVENGDGTANGTANNWASNTLHQNGTTRSKGTVEYFNLTTSLGTTDPADNAAVTIYRNAVGTVTPDEAPGTFQFIRQLQ